MDKLAVNVMEMARQLGISKNSAYALVNQADFPAIRVGGRWIIPVDSLKQWLADSAKEKALCANTNQNVAQRT